jgi:uncharacterized protein (TIGR00266 family)
MQSEVRNNPDFGVLHVRFDTLGESVVAEAGAMVARDSAIRMETNMRGGLGSALKRKLLGGESVFQNTFSCTQPGQTVWIAPAPEGSIQEYDLQAGHELFLQSGAYLASGPDVQLDTKFQGAKGLFSGEGLFLLRAHGQGKLWFSSYGGIHTVDLGDEVQAYKCDTSHMVAFTQGLAYSVSSVGGLKSFLFSGEGLVSTFRGQGRLWMQTRSPAALANFLQPFRRVRHSASG